MARPVERWSPTPLAEAFAIAGAADAGGQIKRRSNVMASCLQKREPVCQLAAALKTGHAYLKIRTTKALCAVYQENDLVKATVTAVAKKGI